jgi:ribosomal protein L22
MSAPENDPDNPEADAPVADVQPTAGADASPAADAAPAFAEDAPAEEPAAAETPKPKRARRTRSPGGSQGTGKPAAGAAGDGEAAAEPAVAAKPKAKAAARKPKAVAAEATDEADAPKPKRPRRTKAGEPAKPAAPAARSKRAARDYGANPPMVRAHAKYVRTSARKARLVCDHIRGKSVEEARAILAHASRDVARDWSKLLESAVANAEHNHELIGDELRIAAVKADEGPTLKRFRPRAMGRATKIRKRTSHLSITLTPKDGEN